MLTKEQIKNLKPGDPVVVRGEFQSVDSDGDFWIKTSNCHRCYDPLSVSLPSEHGTSVPTPKHDPTRLFKKGDKVRVKNVNGRHYNLWSKKVENQIFVVTEDEREYANVYLGVEENRSYGVDPAYLELITPVEEIPTYRVGDFATNGEICVWRNQGWKTEKVCSFNVETHPNAKAAAEAERDRLNAEHRKGNTHE